MKNKLNIIGKILGKETVLVVDTTAFHPFYSYILKNEVGKNFFDYLRVYGFLEIQPYLRNTLKVLDSLLVENGELIIDYYVTDNPYSSNRFIRPVSFFLCEFSIALDGRYKLIERKKEDRIEKFIFQKLRSATQLNDSMDCWTFGIVSDGRKNDRIHQIAEQIKQFNIPKYEILICGPDPQIKNNPFVKVISDSDLYVDTRPPISRKKNRIIDYAQFENIVLMHDRISFPSNWYENIKKHGNNFELLCIPILDEDTGKKRVQDWVYFKGLPEDFSNVRSGSLLYGEWNPYVYQDGGLLIGKTSILRRVRYDDRLHWGEAEDVILSKRLYLNGFQITFYDGCYVTTQTHRHPGFQLSLSKKQIRFGRLRNQIKVFLQQYISLLKFKKYVFDKMRSELEK